MSTNAPNLNVLIAEPGHQNCHHRSEIAPHGLTSTRLSMAHSPVKKVARLNKIFYPAPLFKPLIQQFHLQRPAHRLSAAIHFKLRVDVFDVPFDRLGRNSEGAGDFFVHLTFSDQL